VDARQWGLFVHGQHQFNQRLKLIAGLRFESIDYDYDNLGLDGRTRDDGTECGFGGCRYSRPADSKNSFDHVSPKLEMQYALNSAWSLRASAANSFRAPQATELYRLQREQVIADLDTVEANTYELGVHWQTANTEMDAVIYQLKQNNLIIRDSDFFNINGQATDSIGIEGALDHAFNEKWSIKATATYADHQYASNPDVDNVIVGNQVDTAPRFFAHLITQYQINDRLSADLEMNTINRYYLDIDNQNEYPGHTLIHLRTHYAWNDQWQFSLRVNNLLDKRYAERADFTRFTNERYFPGIPRSVFVSFKRSF